MDDQVRGRQFGAAKVIKSLAKFKFSISEHGAGMEKARKAVEVLVKSTIHQPGLRRLAQIALLFGAQEQVINLICQSKVGIEFEQGLKGAFGVLFERQVEVAGFGECVRKGCFANAGIAGQYDEFSHALIIPSAVENCA